MRVSPLPPGISKAHQSLRLTGAVLGLVIGIAGLVPPATAADGRADTSYGAPVWGWQRPYPPPGYYPAPPAYPYAPPPHGYPYRAPRATICDNGNMVTGALVGAGLGGIIASQAGHGRDNAGLTVFGVLAGAVLGGAVGQAADRANGCY
jgi:hypothetical protein